VPGVGYYNLERADHLVKPNSDICQANFIGEKRFLDHEFSNLAPGIY